MLFFFYRQVFGVLLPSCVVLSLNVRIIQSLRKFSKARKSMMLRHKTSDTESTIMLLSVASYMILSEIPDSVVYLIQPYYPPTSPQHNTYGTVSVIFGTFSLTNYAINILIYSLTGRKFRRIFLICFQRMSCGHCSKDIGGLHMESPSSQVELQHFNLHSRKLDVAQNRQRYTVIATWFRLGWMISFLWRVVGENYTLLPSQLVCSRQQVTGTVNWCGTTL